MGDDMEWFREKVFTKFVLPFKVLGYKIGDTIQIKVTNKHHNWGYYKRPKQPLGTLYYTYDTRRTKAHGTNMKVVMYGDFDEKLKMYIEQKRASHTAFTTTLSKVAKRNVYIPEAEDMVRDFLYKRRD